MELSQLEIGSEIGSAQTQGVVGWQWGLKDHCPLFSAEKKEGQTAKH